MAKTAQTCDRAAAARLAVTALVRSATVVGRPGEAAYGKLECAFGDTPGLRHDFVSAVAESCEAGGGREPWRLLADAAWRRQRSPRRLAADAALVAERLGLNDVADVQAGLASPAAPAEALAALFVLAAGIDGAGGRRLLTRLGLDPYAASHRLRYPRAGTGSPPFALARLFA